MKKEFPMTGGSLINSFLGIAAIHNAKGMFLHQTKYEEEILIRAGMQDCKPVSTPVDLKSKLAEDIGKPVEDTTHYRSLAGALQYLTFTRPDIAYAVQQICLFMHDPIPETFTYKLYGAFYVTYKVPKTKVYNC